MKRRVALLATLLLLALAGCFEERLTVELTPDGQGSFVVERTLGRRLSQAVKDDERVAAHVLAQWQGVVAWSDVSASRTEQGRLRIGATGWFTDVNALRRRAARDGLAFSLQRTPDRIELTLTEETGLSADSLLESIAVEADRVMQKTALEGFARRVVVVLPGELTEVRGLKRIEGDRRRAELRRGREGVLELADTTAHLATLMRAAVAKGDLDEAAAKAKLAQTLATETVHSARCDGSGSGSSPAFREGLRRALESWRSGPWSARVRLQRKVMASALDDAPLDRFEPNESDERARELKTGVHGPLWCTGEDWYRVAVPADRLLRVRIAGEGGDLDLELFGADGAAARSASDGTSHEAAALTVLRADAEVLVRVHGPLASYTLRVDLEPAQPADGHEPNNSRAAASPLGAGEHTQLRCDGEDWYRVAVPEGRRLRVRATFPQTEGDLDLALHAPDGALLVESAGRSGVESTELSGGPATVLVRVYGGCGVYGLTVSIEAIPE